MKKSKEHFIATLESFDEGVEVMLDHTDVIDSVDYEYQAMQDGRAADYCVDIMDGAESEIASLESLVHAINEARDVGMEAMSAQFAHSHLRKAQQRYGVTGEPLPSLESFNGRQARLSTSVSMEAVRDTIRKIWEWLKEQFKKFLVLVERFYQNFTKSLDLIARDADALKNEVRRMKFDGGQSIDLGVAARKICLNGKVSTDFTSPLNRVAALSRIGEDTLQRIEVETAVVFEHQMEQGNPERFNPEVLVPSGFVAKNLGESAGPLEAKTYTSLLLPGDRALAVEVFGETNRTNAAFSNSGRMARGTVWVYKTAADTATSEAASLSSSDVFTLCQRISKCVSSLKSARADVEAHIKRVQRKVDDIAKSHHEAEGLVAEKLEQLARWYYRTNAVYGTQLTRLADSIAFDICVGYLTYARRSIAAGQQAA